MGSGEREKDFGWCNIIIKFLLFMCNIVVWLLGIALLGIGIYVQVESAFQDIGLDSILTSPSVVLIILGSVLFIIGFCGCLGALLELFPLLLVYVIVLSIIVMVEVALVIYIFVEQDTAYDSFENALDSLIVTYYDDINRRNIIDVVQGSFLKCCGVDGPGDWEQNIYFNCSSIAFQRCSVPFSCCILEEGEVLNLQCGYRTLDPEDARFQQDIYTEGCLVKIRTLVQSNVYVVAGVGIGLLVFQIINILLAIGLAVDVRKEKAAMKIIKKQKKQQQQLEQQQQQ